MTRQVKRRLHIIRKRAHRHKNGFSYQIKYDDGSTKWIPGKDMDQKILDTYKLNLKLSTQKSSPLTPNKILLGIAVIFALLNSIDAIDLNDKFRHCQTKEINRIVNQYPDCMHPKTLKMSLARHVPDLEELLYSGKFPSKAFVLMKNKYYLNQIGF